MASSGQLSTAGGEGLNLKLVKARYAAELGVQGVVAGFGGVLGVGQADRPGYGSTKRPTLATGSS